MAIRPILHYPDKRLRIPGERVTDFGPELHTLIDDMAETMYAAPGVGLAATQLGIAQRVFLIDIASSSTRRSSRAPARSCGRRGASRSPACTRRSSAPSA